MEEKSVQDSIKKYVLSTLCKDVKKRVTDYGTFSVESIAERFEIILRKSEV